VARGYLRGSHTWEGADCLYSGQVAASKFRFNRHEYADVSVSTGNDLPVDVYVIDRYGIVNSDESSSANKVVAWTTGGDESITIAVKAAYGATCYGLYIQ